MTIPSTSRRAGAAQADPAVKNAAFSTGADLARLTIDDIDDNGLTTDFESATFTINNNVTPKYVLARPGPKYQNVGNLSVTMESTLLLNDPRVIAAIRRNDTVGYNTHLNNEDGNYFFDIPASTLSGGGRSYPENDAVSISVGIEAHEDSRFDFASVMVSTIPVTLPNFSIQRLI